MRTDLNILLTLIFLVTSTLAINVFTTTPATKTPLKKLFSSDMITRAKFWNNEGGIPYSQSTYSQDPEGEYYRTDCSGYVSMAWQLPSNMSTQTLSQVSYKIEKDELQSGDILLNVKGRHVVIFDKWTSDSKTRYWAYEQGNYTKIKRKTAYHQIDYPYWSTSTQGYVPYRYVNVMSDKNVTVSTELPIGKCTCPAENPYQIGGDGSTDDYCGDRMRGACVLTKLYSCIFQAGEDPLIGFEQACPLGCETVTWKSVKPYMKSTCSLKAKALPKSNEILDTDGEGSYKEVREYSGSLDQNANSRAPLSPYIIRTTNVLCVAIIMRIQYF